MYQTHDVYNAKYTSLVTKATVNNDRTQNYCKAENAQYIDSPVS